MAIFQTLDTIPWRHARGFDDPFLSLARTGDVTATESPIDRHSGIRHTAIPMLSTGVTLCLTILAGRHQGLVIVLFCLAGLTSQAYLPAFWTLPTTLLGKSAAAAAVGFISLGNIGGFVGPYLFGYLKTATGHYEAGLWCLAGCMLAAGALATRIRVER